MKKKLLKSHFSLSSIKYKKNYVQRASPIIELSIATEEQI